MFFKNTVIGIVLFFTFCVQATTFDRNKSAILVDDTNLNDPLKLKQVFAQILVNNTGETISDVLNNPVFLETNIKSGLKRSYVEQIESEFLPENSTYHYWFYAVMQQKFIDKVIADAQFSVLPQSYEKIMAWVVIENELSPDEQLSEIDTPNYAYEDTRLMYWINHWSNSMGIDLAFPKNDEIDNINVTPQSIKSLSFEAQKQSQGRYFVTHNLLLSIDQQKDVIKARSGYVNEENQMAINHFQDLTGDIGSLLYSVFDDLNIRFAQQFKIDSANIQRHTVQIVINNLATYNDVMQVQEYLRLLSVIDSSTIVSATNAQLVMTSELTITTESFLNMINRDNYLSLDNQGVTNQLILSLNTNQ